MKNNNSIVDVLTFGFALFAMFFGAGNLIFPPYLGVISGSYWFITFLSFTTTAVGLALIALIAITYYDCDITKFFKQIGEFPGLILSFMVIMCVGPLLVIPRTGATAYEMGIKPILGFHNIYTITISVIIFYLLTYFLTVRPSKVVDIIGKFLTPFLIIALIIIIIKGSLYPLGAPIKNPQINNIISKGLIDGYQTMDCFVSLAVGTVLLLTLKTKGYNEHKTQIKMLFKSGIIACLILGIIYGGLTYLGASVSSKYGIDAQKSQIIVNITQGLLGNTGKIILSIASFMACLTTAIGLASASGEYLVNITKGKIKYSTFILIFCIFGTITAIIGVSGIVKIGEPILSVVYPPTIILIVLSFFKNKIKNSNTFKFPVFTSVIISILTLLSNQFEFLTFIKKLPLGNFGFGWIIPSIIMLVVSILYKQK